MILYRSLLFTPAIYPDRFEKSYECGSDGIIVDMEDGVGLLQKDTARKNLQPYFSKKTHPHFVRALRINSLSTPQCLSDLQAMIEMNIIPDILILPKVQSSEQILVIDELFSGTIPLMAFLESPKGIANAREIALSSPRLVALAFGVGDYAASLHASSDWDTMSFARAQLVQATAEASIDALDGPYFDIDNPVGLAQEIEKSVRFGFAGKLAIHPSQISAINQGFSPTREAIEKATQIVRAMEASHGGACIVDGKMVDQPILISAKQIVARAEKINKRSHGTSSST
ncbi:MAG: CoA ester lyase [Chlamydiales bacterium]|nr:CoA ester lyase [Chlamydiales bacterium]